MNTRRPVNPQLVTALPRPVTARRIALGRILVLACLATSPSCHTWGFNRPVDMPPASEHVLADGVKWEDLHIGGGKAAASGSRVWVHYTGRLESGAKFDSSVDRGAPFEFVVGSGAVIAGWDESMPGMRAGGKRRVVVPPDRAYGTEGRAGVIPPNATLVLEIELLSVE